jgi:hypothetical protein
MYQGMQHSSMHVNEMKMACWDQGEYIYIYHEMKMGMFGAGRPGVCTSWRVKKIVNLPLFCGGAMDA